MEAFLLALADQNADQGKGKEGTSGQEQVSAGEK